MNCYTQSGITQIEGKILFLGDSIGDDGRFISFLNTYFRLYNPRADVQLFNLGVCSETISGASEPDHPFPRPCLLNRLDKAISTVKPDWVIMCYGVNDGIYYPQSDERFLAYKDGYKKAIERLKKDNIKIAVMTPPPFDAQSFKKTYGDVLLPKCADKFSYEKPYESYNDVLDDYADWIKSTLVNDVDIVIDVRSWLTRDTAGIRENHPEYLSGDGIHPHEHGHCVMAHCILEDFFGVSLSKFAIQLEQDNFSLFHLVYECDSILHKVLKEEVGHDNPNKENCIASYKLEQSILECEQKIADYISEHPELSDYVEDWEGFETHYIHISGYEVILACPKVAAQGNPWAWRTEFFGAYPSTDIMLLKNGWHVAHIAIPNRFGAPIIMQDLENFNEEIISMYSLAPKTALIGFSRGGLYALFYAAAHPQRISALYLDAPVVDLRSWPAGRGDGEGSPYDWEICKKAWGLTENDANKYEAIVQNAIDSLLENRLPMVIAAGDADVTVPYHENGIRYTNAYAKTDIPFKLIIRPGEGHHPHSLQDPTPIANFLLDNVNK